MANTDNFLKMRVEDGNSAEALQVHHLMRGGGHLPPGIAQACVLVVASGLSEPGSGWGDAASLQPLRDWAEADCPEGRVCRIWVEGEEDVVGELATLLQLELWKPVRPLAYRALAHFGLRRTLASLLPNKGPWELPEVDAWMEAARRSDAEPLRVASQDSPWSALIQAELEPDNNVTVLEALAANTGSDSPRAGAEEQNQWIAGRASAALARLCLARGEGEVIQIAGVHIPAWERAYLQGLATWQGGDKFAAQSHLRDALARNPQQTCVRLALSCILAAQSPEEALQLTEHREPTCELLIQRAALLARMKHYSEAEEALSQDAPWEAIRFSWIRGQDGFRRQEKLLRTALAEHRRDWTAAEKNWRSACSAQTEKGLREARELFMAGSQLQAQASLGGWARNLLERKADRLRTHLGAVPLTGDARFFRSAALLKAEPARALFDLQALRKRRTWREGELAAGGERVVCIADAMLRLGEPTEAAEVYRAIPGSQERTAVASVYARLLHGGTGEELAAAAEEAPESPWPRLLATLALLIAGNKQGAEEMLSLAEQKGAESEICRRLRAVSAAITGTLKTSQQELVELGVPPDVSAAICLAVGSEPEPVKLRAYISAFGDRWIEFCPIDPRLLAQRSLTRLCEAELWDEALEFADQLMASDMAWAQELYMLVHLRRALERACRGDIVEAEGELREFNNGIVL